MLTFSHSIKMWYSIHKWWLLFYLDEQILIGCKPTFPENIMLFCSTLSHFSPCAHSDKSTLGFLFTLNKAASLIFLKELEFPPWPHRGSLYQHMKSRQQLLMSHQLVESKVQFITSDNWGKKRWLLFPALVFLHWKTILSQICCKLVSLLRIWAYYQVKY